MSLWPSAPAICSSSEELLKVSSRASLICRFVASCVIALSAAALSSFVSVVKLWSSRSSLPRRNTAIGTSLGADASNRTIFCRTCTCDVASVFRPSTNRIVGGADKFFVVTKFVYTPAGSLSAAFSASEALAIARSSSRKDAICCSLLCPLACSMI